MLPHGSPASQGRGPAQAAIRMVLMQPGISSQLVDNLNASIHVRALLTDVFLLDEAVKRLREADREMQLRQRVLRRLVQPEQVRALSAG